MTQTGDVRPEHQFDQAALAAYLADQGLSGAADGLSVRQFDGGQSNPTFLLETPHRRYVLRKKPPGALLPSAHLIEREFRIMKALAPTAVPVPAVHLLCEDPGVIGTSFYVMDFLDWRILPVPACPELSGPAERNAVYMAMADTLADLHRVDIHDAGLADFGKPQGYVARQIKRWSQQYQAAKTGEIPAMDRLIAWLPDAMPAAEETAIAHGDIRLDNMILHPTEPRVLAVLDWELSTLGHPLGDLAYNCMPYYLPADQPALKGLRGLDLAALGIPSEEAYLARYCERVGRDGIPDWTFFLAFSLFRLAAICQGVYARGLQGNAASARAGLYGAVAITLAETGWRLAESA